MYQTLRDMLSIIVSNYHFGKRCMLCVMIIFSLHFQPNVTNSVFSYWWHFPNSAPRPSPELIFCFILVPCGWEIKFGYTTYGGCTFWELADVRIVLGYPPALPSTLTLLPSLPPTSLPYPSEHFEATIWCVCIYVYMICLPSRTNRCNMSDSQVVFLRSSPPLRQFS